jgi:hypothetical protein
MSSDIVSSHWEVEGQGFGDLCENTLKNRILKYPKRVFVNSLLRMYACDETIKSAGINTLKKQNRLLCFDSAKQMLSLTKICEALRIDTEANNPLVNNGIKTVCVIGDGYGFFASLVKEFDPCVKVISINLDKIQKYDRLFATTNDICYLKAEEYDKLKNRDINLFISIAAFQEMNYSTIKYYFAYMRSSIGKPACFYCCCRVAKELPDGTVIEFNKYPWDEKEEKLIDELCPWYRYEINLIPPFIHKFDGLVWHRLVKLRKGIGGMI